MAKPSDKRVIEIAEYIWGDYGKKTAEILSYFAQKFRISERRVQTLLTKARVYNKERQISLEKKKDEVLAHSELKSLKKAIITREMIEAKLADIALNDFRTVTFKQDGKTIEKVTMRKESDQIAAAKELLEMRGEKAAIKTENLINISGLPAKPVEKMTDEELFSIIGEKELTQTNA